jgi:hypothetical protein
VDEPPDAVENFTKPVHDPVDSAVNKPSTPAAKLL